MPDAYSMRPLRIAAILLLGAALSFLGLPARAVESLQVLALFQDKAMLRIDGENRLLRAGEVSAEGVRLIAADARRAVVEVSGEQRELTLGGHIATEFQSREAREVRILRDVSGAFLTTGTINGRRVEMMVDTGATVVALGSADAKRLGIPYRMEGRPVGVATASGSATGYLVTLDSVQVGEILVRNVEATVIDGAGPPKVLLGMSFLGRVEMQNSGAVLLLKKRH